MQGVEVPSQQNPNAEPFVTSNNGNRGSSRRSNTGMGVDTGNNTDSMGMGDNIYFVEGDIG
jgi:hypothetical protein